MRPVSCRVAKLVPGVHVDVLHQEHLHEVRVALSRRNMQARETLLILNVRIAAAIQKLLHGLFHIALSRQHQGCVVTDRLVVGLVHLRLSLE